MMSFRTSALSPRYIHGYKIRASQRYKWDINRTQSGYIFMQPEMLTDICLKVYVRYSQVISIIYPGNSQMAYMSDISGIYPGFIRYASKIFHEYTGPYLCLIHRPRTKCLRILTTNYSDLRKNQNTLCPAVESNRRPFVYKSTALPCSHQQLITMSGNFLYLNLISL